MKSLIVLSGLFSGMAFADAGIINGDDAEEAYYPESGGLLAGTVLEFGGSEYELKMLMCSSTLIAPDVVLTAAHCIDFSYYEQMSGMPFDDVELVFSRHATALKPSSAS